jgi:outer membrane immunogenic protein
MTRTHRRLLLGAAPLAVALAAPAFGADLPVKALPVKAPVAVPFSWTGWYIGLNAGYGVGQGYGTYANRTFETFNAIPGGGLGGGQFGYNYQIGNSFVIGAETDIQGAGISDTRTCLLGCVPGSSALIDHKLDWFGTTRARFGLATGPVLSYFTAGAAYGGVQTGVSTPTGSLTNTTTKTGWTWGAGVEAALGGNWTAKAEYLYVDFGSTGVASPATGSLSVKNEDQIFRGGVNYRFGPAQPAASFGPAYNWAGVFIGGTFGYGLGRNDSTFTEPGTGAEQFNLSPRGFEGGGIVGYNWQFGSWVLGLEGDFQDSTGSGFLTGLADGTTIDQKLSWFGTARGRLGYSVGQALVYATGGAAFGEVKEGITQAAAAGSFSHSKSGFAVGGGIENKLDFFGLLSSNWTTRTEYLFVDLGSINDTLVPIGGGPAETLNSNLHEHIWRTVVSYKFGTP